MKIEAKIIADSKNEFNNRLTTMLITFPRYILAEVNTHRMFSKNTSSSRAIPFEKMLESIVNNPFIPLAWQKDHKGMQGTEYLNERDSEVCKSAWIVSRNKAVEQAKHLSERGLTKQLCNRIMEPYMWTTMVITATDWENFFALRCPQYYINNVPYRSKKDALNSKDGQFHSPSESQWKSLNRGQADIHMMALAEAMWDCMNKSTPKELKTGEWHIPYGDKIWIAGLNGIESNTMDTVKIATVMCARVSYTTLDSEQSEWTNEKYIAKHNELKGANPKHMSPFEHCAMCDIDSTNSGNFTGGWIQYRKMIPNENITNATKS